MKKVLLDTNVFLLYLMGLIDPRKISSFKRTSIYITKYDKVKEEKIYECLIVTNP